MEGEKIHSVELARRVANSQFDLGLTSKERIVGVISGFPYHLANMQNERESTYSQLDPISKIIVDAFTSNEDVEGAATDLKYAIACLNAAVEVLPKSNNLSVSK